MVPKFKFFSLCCSVAIGAIGIMVLIGWAVDVPLLKSITPNLVPMKPNSALGFVLTSISLLLQQTPERPRYVTVIAKMCAALILAIGLATFLEHVTGQDFYIDQLVGQKVLGVSATVSPPGQMSLITSMMLSLTGLLLLALDANVKAIWPIQGFSILIGLTGVLTISGLAYYTHVDFKLAPYLNSALHTAINFVLAGLALFTLRPDKGLCGLLSAHSPTAWLARCLLPLILILMFFIGLFRLHAQEAGWYDTKTGIVFMVFANSLIVLVLAFFALNTILKIEAAHNRLEEELQKNELQLKQALESLERSNAELEQFAYTASHDLQEPLRTILGYTSLLSRRYQDKLDNDAKDFIGFINDSTNRMVELIHDLLEYSRVTTKTKPFQPADCNIVLQHVLDDLAVDIAARHAHIQHGPLPTVKADEIQLARLFQNLLSNAIKFCDKGEPLVEISAKESENNWTFSVSDNGIGIEPKYFDKLFILFRRLVPRGLYAGTGIGLATCKKILDRHGGKIWVESQPNKGSTFYFTLPK